MIFVNEVAGVSEIPAWLKHVPPNEDGMTFVDLVFPAFLFIVGMAIPLAIGRRLDRGEAKLPIISHIVTRTLSLLIVGVFMVNIGRINPEASGISKNGWVFLLFIAVILIWNQYPKLSGGLRWLFSGLRLLGITILLFLAYIYRSGSAENPTWMSTSWWGIIGLIGWAYLTACVVFLFFRRQMGGLVGMIALLILLFIGDKSGAIDFLSPISKYLNIGAHIGGHGAITVAGVVLALLVLDGASSRSPWQQALRIISFGILLAAAGYLLRPLYGISKNEATPTWCLYSCSICCFVYAGLYWVIDVRQWKRWSAVLSPVGANPLLAYILPFLLWSAMGLIGVDYFHNHLNTGVVGVIRSIIFSFLMIAVTLGLSRLRISLRL